MTEHDILIDKISRLAKFLGENGHLAWADRLGGLTGRSGIQMPLQQLRANVRQCFGAMGSLTDIDVYFENDPQRTKEANLSLNRLLDDLFEAVNDKVSPRK